MAGKEKGVKGGRSKRPLRYGSLKSVPNPVSEDSRAEARELIASYRPEAPVRQIHAIVDYGAARGCYYCHRPSGHEKHCKVLVARLLKLVPAAE